jgi:hypothetical protein
VTIPGDAVSDLVRWDERGTGRCSRLATDQFGAKLVQVTGWTSSGDFPLKDAFQGSLAGGTDGFVASFKKSNLDLVKSSYLGGKDKGDTSGTRRGLIAEALAAGKLVVGSHSQRLRRQGPVPAPVADAPRPAIMPSKTKRAPAGAAGARLGVDRGAEVGRARPPRAGPGCG